MESMKTSLLAFVGLSLGVLAAYYLLGITFNLPYKKYFPIILLPIGIAAITSFFIAVIDPENWWLVGTVALPTVLLSLLFVVADWKWLLDATVAIGVCAIAGWLGQKIRGIMMR